MTDPDLWAEWPAPIPLAAVQLPAFPAEVLPGWVRDYVTAEATATQTPTDLPALLALAALAAGAGGRVVVEARPGWREPTNLYTAIALPPGNRKSQVYADISRPLYAEERRLIEAAAERIIEAKTERAIAEGVADEARKAVASASRSRRKLTREQAAAAEREREDLAQEATKAALMAEAITVPPAPRLLADDVTPEALASLLADHGRMAVFSAEGGVFGQMRGRYSQAGPNLDVYLKGHPGDELRVDRQGRPPQIVSRPALTIGITVQPGVLTDAAQEAAFRERGLLARFLYAVPESFVGRRQIAPPPVPEPVAELYDRRLRALVATFADHTEPVTLTLDLEAAAALIGFERWLEPRIDPEGPYGAIVEWGAKLAGAVVRIAGLLHLADRLERGWGDPITARYMDAAIVIGEYLATHAAAAFSLMGADQTVADARAVLAWAKRNHLETFTRRDCHQAHRSRFATADDVDPALDLLTAHGWIRPLPDIPTGGRPTSPAYETHPGLARKLQTPTQNPQNPQKPPSESCEVSEYAAASSAIGVANAPPTERTGP